MKVIQKIKDEYKKSPSDFVFILLFALIVFGFATPDAHVPISIGVFGLFLLGIFEMKKHSSTLQQKGIILLPVLYFCVTVFSGINSEDKRGWLDWVRLTLPFLLLPVAFWGVQLKNETFRKSLQVFIVIMSLSLLCVLIWYGLHFEEFSYRLNRGIPIPTPHSHIRFSLLLVTAFYSSVWLRGKMKYWWVFAAFLFIGVHLLSVRSALMSLYAGFLFFAFQLIFSKQKLLGLVILINTGILFVVAYTQIPSLQNRINYMMYDFEQFQNGNIEGFSDGVRFASMQAGWEMWQKNFWFGVGIGDIKQESEQQMLDNYPGIKNQLYLKMPHNQYLWTACATGVFGLLTLLFSFLFPLWYFRNQMDWLFIVLQILFGSAFLVEYMLEGQVGGTFYVLFQSLFYSFLNLKKQT